jgi:hypothetical protein
MKKSIKALDNKYFTPAISAKNPLQYSFQWFYPEWRTTRYILE